MKKMLFFLLVASSCWSSKAQVVDLSNGLVLYLPFDGNTLDASPNGNHAINYGAVPATDQWGNANSAYYFNGINNFMQIANRSSLQPDSGITLSARVNVAGFYNGLCYGNCIIQKGFDGTSETYTLRFSPVNNYGNCYLQDTNNHNYYGSFDSKGVSYGVMNTPPHVRKGDWDCLIFTYDGNVQRMYVNGIMRYSAPVTGLLGRSSDDVFLGRLNSSLYPYWFKGTMDEVRIYNRGLNAEEIDSLCKFVPRRQQGHNMQQMAAQPSVMSRPLQDIPFPDQQVPGHLEVQNPVGSLLILRLGSDQLGGTLFITDLMGREVMRRDNLDQPQLELAQLPPGNYLLQYRSKQGVLLRAQIVKD